MADPTSNNGCMRKLANFPPQGASLLLIITKIKHFRALESDHAQGTI